MRRIDGSMMEGGGQLLRMATSYSAILGEPITVDKIRENRSQPGLKPQHLTTLKAAASLCGAEVEGARIGSRRITFVPNTIQGGIYRFDIGTAGSVSLFLQCVAPIMLYADGRVSVTVEGGTAVRWSPTFTFMENVVWRGYRMMGADLESTVMRHGFYPKGGGRVKVTVQPGGGFRGAQFTPRDVDTVHGVSLCGKLPAHVAERQMSSARKILRREGLKAVTDWAQTEETYSPGSFICLWAFNTPLGADSLGERGKPAEKVGAAAARSLINQLRHGASVDRNTADNLVLPMSLADGDSWFRTSELSLHTLTAIRLAEMFTNSRFTVEGAQGQPATVTCRVAAGK